MLPSSLRNKNHSTFGGVTYSSKTAEAKNIKVGMTQLSLNQEDQARVFEENG